MAVFLKRFTHIIEGEANLSIDNNFKTSSLRRAKILCCPMYRLIFPGYRMNERFKKKYFTRQ